MDDAYGTHRLASGLQVKWLLQRTSGHWMRHVRVEFRKWQGVEMAGDMAGAQGR